MLLGWGSLVPAGVVTLTLTDAEPPPYGGETAFIVESDSTVKLVAALSPNRTAVAPVKPVP
jgi:hypothetical protein